MMQLYAVLFSRDRKEYGLCPCDIGPARCWYWLPRRFLAKHSTADSSESRTVWDGQTVAAAWCSTRHIVLWIEAHCSNGCFRDRASWMFAAAAWQSHSARCSSWILLVSSWILLVSSIDWTHTCLRLAFSWWAA